MSELCSEAETMLHATAKAQSLELVLPYHDVFYSCSNHPEPTEILQRACLEQNIPLHTAQPPMRYSEDFGLFGTQAKSATSLLGSGVDQPQLHNPDFDFPDALISIGAKTFLHTIRQLLN